MPRARAPPRKAGLRDRIAALRARANADALKVPWTTLRRPRASNAFIRNSRDGSGGSGHNHFHGLVPMSTTSMRRALAGWGVALTVALTHACGGSANLPAEGDAAPDSGAQAIAADGSTDTGQETARDASVADSSPGADATTGIDASADASTQGGKDSTAPPTGDAAADDGSSTGDAAADDASMTADSGEASGSDATSDACGTTGLACCSGNQCDATGLWCVGGRCVACGNPGTPCCGTTCNAGNVCFAVGSLSQCQACGQPGQPCCTTEPACPGGGSTVSGQGLCFCSGGSCTFTCSDPSHTCWFNVCVVCGDVGEPCCGSTCSSGLSCGGGSCR
jgi:hypothetical protein